AIADALKIFHVDHNARTKAMAPIDIYPSQPIHPAVPSEFVRSRATPWYTYVILSIVDREPQEVAAWRFDESTKRFEREEMVRLPTETDSRKRRRATKR